MTYNIEYRLSAEDMDTGEIIYHRSSFSPEIIEESLKTAEDQVAQYIIDNYDHDHKEEGCDCEEIIPF